MDNWHKNLIWFAISFALSACNQESAPDCIQSTGPVIKKQFLFSNSIKSVEISDNIDVEIINSVEDFLELEAGKNLMPDIKLQFVEGTLKISNENHCNWVRKYTHPKIRISSSSLSQITHHGFGNIYSPDTILRKDLSINCQQAQGDIDLKIAVEKLYLGSNSLSNIRLIGKAAELHIGFYNNDGNLSSEDLAAHEVYVYHEGSNAIKVYPIESLTVDIKSNGNVFYKGSPKSISTSIKGKGTVLKL